MVPTTEVPAFVSFEATVVRYADDPDECTIHPRNVDEARETTAWITAREGSFCSPQSRS